MQHPQSGNIVAWDRIFGPEDDVSFVLKQPYRFDGFLSRPGFVRIDHDPPAPAGRLAQQRQPVQVALDLGMPDLDLECAKALSSCFAKQFLEVVVREVKIQAARVEGHAPAFGAKHLP